MQNKKTVIKKRLYPVVIMFFLVIAPVTLGQTKVLTLDQAVDLALKADYQIKTDNNNLASAELAVKNEVLKIYPQATVSGQYQYQITENSYPHSYQVTIEETIPTQFNLYGAKITSAIEAAGWERLLADTTLQIDQSEVIYNTYQDYLSVLKCQQVIKQYVQAVTAYKEENAIAIQQLSLGKITKPNQLQIETYLNQAEYNLEKSRLDLEIALQKLANQIGLKDLSEYTLEEATPNTPVLNLELTSLQQQALRKRLELKEDEIRQKKAQRSWAQSKNDELPTASLSYNDRRTDSYYGLSFDFLSGDFSWMGSLKSDSNDTKNDILSDSSNRNYFGANNRYYTLKFEWTFDYGAAANVTKQNQYSLENAKLQIAKDEQSILLEVKQALADYRMALKQHEVDEKALVYHEKDLEIKELQKQLGVITYSDLYEAMKDALEARITAVKSDYDRLTAYQKLEKTTGGLYTFDHQSKLEGK